MESKVSVSAMSGAASCMTMTQVTMAAKWRAAAGSGPGVGNRTKTGKKTFLDKLKSSSTNRLEDTDVWCYAWTVTVTVTREGSPSPESRSVSICSFNSDTVWPSVSLSSHTQDGDGVKVKQSDAMNWRITPLQCLSVVSIWCSPFSAELGLDRACVEHLHRNLCSHHKIDFNTKIVIETKPIFLIDLSCDKTAIWPDRGTHDSCDDADGDKLAGKQLLSPFQQDKFRHFFYHVLDLNTDHVISEEDFQALNNRVRLLHQNIIS